MTYQGPNYNILWIIGYTCAQLGYSREKFATLRHRITHGKEDPYTVLRQLQGAQSC